MFIKKRKLYNPTSPGDDVGEYLMDVKQKLQNFHSPIKPKIKPVKDPKTFIETIAMLQPNLQHTVEKAIVEKDEKEHDQKYINKDELQKINEKKMETEIYSELKEKLMIKKEIAGTKNSVKLWYGIKFKFSKQNLFSSQNLRKFRMQFNPVGIVNNKENSQTSEHPLMISEENPEATFSEKPTERSIKQVVNQKSLPLLNEIFENHMNNIIAKHDQIENSNGVDENFVSQHLGASVELNTETDNETPSTAAVMTSSFEKDIQEAFNNFFNSLSDVESDDDLVFCGTLSKLETPSLSESAKKIRGIEPAISAHYENIVTRIMKLETSQPCKRNEQKFLLQKENIPLNQNIQRQHQVSENKILLKNQTIIEAQVNPPQVKATTKLVSNRVFDELDRLNDKFKMDLKSKSSKTPLQTQNEDHKYYSIFQEQQAERGNPKLQLKPKNDKNISSVTDDPREEKLQKAIEDLQRNKNVSTYMNEFCRLKFGD